MSNGEAEIFWLSMGSPRGGNPVEYVRDPYAIRGREQFDTAL